MAKAYDRLKSFLTVSGDDPDLARAQYMAYSKQPPVLYAILLTNTLALAVTHVSVAPFTLTLILPTMLGAGCLIRIVVWRLRSRTTESDESMIKRLRGTVLLTGSLGTGFTTWALSLYPYGNAFGHCHVAFYMSLTVISCIFCLMHVRGAALLLPGWSARDRHHLAGRDPATRVDRDRHPGCIP